MGGLPIVSLPAEVDIANAHLVRSALEEECTGDSVVVADMTMTTLLTAAGVNILVVMGTGLRDAGGELRLVVESAAVQRVLEVLKIDQLLRIFPSLPDALGGEGEESLSYGRAA